MGSKRVHIRVGEDRRDKWHGHATEDFGDKYGSVSALIRDAVETQMDIDKGNLSAGSSEVSNASQQPKANGRIDAILTGVEDNSASLESIEERLSRIHETMASGGGVSTRVQSDVYGALVEIEATMDPVKKINTAGITSTEVAERADVSVEQAESALAQLRREYDDVQMRFREDDDEPLWWREA